MLVSSGMKILGVSAVVVAMLMGGCTASKRDTANVRVYPQSTPRGATVDIQVFREGRTLSATNTTTRVFGDSMLWVNKRFGHPLSGWKPGETVSFDLNTFYDEFGEQFRGGGFFARETPEDVVLVQVETDGAAGREMVGFVVVGGKARP